MKIRAGLSMAAAGATAVFALAGCGGADQARDTAATPAATASSSSGAASGARLADVLQKSVAEGRSAHVAFDMGRQGAGEGDVSFDGGAPVMAMRVSFGSKKAEIRLVDGVVYVAMPDAGGKFMKMDLGRTGTALGMDPSKALAELQKRSGAFTEVAPGHWQAGQDGVTTDVFVGDDGYLEKVQVHDEGRTITMSFSDWGEKVTVRAPDPADVVRGPGIWPPRS